MKPNMPHLSVVIAVLAVVISLTLPGDVLAAGQGAGHIGFWTGISRWWLGLFVHQQATPMHIPGTQIIGPLPTPTPTPMPVPSSFAPALLQSDRPLSLLGTGLLRISSFGDLYPIDGIAPALGTTTHPYSQLNLTKASIDGSGNETLAGGLSVGGLSDGFLHADKTGKLFTLQIDLGKDITSTLGVGNGGTGQTTLTQYGVLYGNGTSGVGTLAPGTSGLLLQSNGSGAAPSWVAANGLSAGSVAFAGVTGGTNSTAAMLVGAGASLGFTGTGTINASSLLGNTWAAPSAIGGSTPAAATFTTAALTNTGNALVLSGTGATIQFSGVALAQITTATNQSLALMPGGSGNVGIGTTTPGAALEVNGNVKLGGTSRYLMAGGMYTPSAGGQDFRVLTTGSTAIGATNEGLRTATWDFFDTNPSNVDTALLMLDTIQTSNTGAATIKKTGIHAKSYTMPDNGGDTSAGLFTQSGGGGAITAYKVAGLRPSGYTDYSMSPQGALEAATDGGSQAVLGIVGLQGFAAVASTTTTASSGTGTGALAVTTTAGFPVPGQAPYAGATNLPGTLYARLSDGTNTEWVAYTAVPDGTHLTISQRGLGGKGPFTFASGATIAVAPRGTAGWFRIDDGVSDGIVVTPNNGQFDSNRYGLAIGNKVVGGAPTSLTFSVSLDGNLFTTMAKVSGSGQNSINPTTSANLGASLTLQDSQGAANSGGFLIFGAQQGSFAGIKGLLADGSNNTAGTLSFLTRNLTTDTTLTERLRISTAGNVGIGTTAPVNRLDVNGSVAIGSYAGTNTAGTNGLIVSGNVGIGTTAPTLGPLQMGSGAYVTSGGVWTNASDRNLKTNFTSLDAQAVLAKIDTLPVTEWNYKSEDARIKHIGPVAQDFYSIFGVGNTNTSISTIDPAGIALLGIQALDQKYQQLAQQSLVGAAQPSSTAISTESVASLQESVQSLTDRVTALEKQAPVQPSPISASLSAALSGMSLSLDKDATISGSLAVQGRTTLNDLGITGNITAGILSIHGLDGTIDAIGNTLKLQSLGTGSIDLLAGKVTVDEHGNIIAKGEIITQKINVDESDPASASIGNGTLKAGDSQVVISTKAVHTKSHIFATPRGKTGDHQIEVGTVIDGASFTVQIEHSYTSDISFDWWIVN